MFCGSSCAQTTSLERAGRARRARAACLDRERVELLDARDRDVRRRCSRPRGRRCRSRPSRSRGRAGARASWSALRVVEHGLEARRRAELVERRRRLLEPQQALRRHHDERPRRSRRAPAGAAGGSTARRSCRLAIRMFSCAASWRNRSSRALECSGPVALVAVREQQRQPRRLPPLREAGDDELVDDDLRAVDEVAELRLPEHERLGRRDRVAVLEPERGVLRERRVVDLERRVAPRRGAGSACSARRSPTSCRTRCRCENVPRSVSWPVSRIGMPSTSSVANASASAWPQSMPPSSSASRRRSSCVVSFGWTVKPSGTREQLVGQLAEPVGRRPR